MTTVRELCDGLTELATLLPGGLEAPIELGICNGEDLQLIEDVDLDCWTRVAEDGSPVRQFALLRGHMHPGQRAGELLPGVAADIDRELRKLMDDSSEG